MKWHNITTKQYNHDCLRLNICILNRKVVVWFRLSSPCVVKLMSGMISDDQKWVSNIHNQNESNSVPIMPSLCLILYDWTRYALTRHIGTHLSSVRVCQSNSNFDCTCSRGYLSAKEAVFILTVLCQRSATNDRALNSYLNIPSNALKLF